MILQLRTNAVGAACARCLRTVRGRTLPTTQTRLRHPIRRHSFNRAIWWTDILVWWPPPVHYHWLDLLRVWVWLGWTGIAILVVLRTIVSAGGV